MSLSSVVVVGNALRLNRLLTAAEPARERGFVAQPLEGQVGR
jgi:hypothetical protein